MKSFLPRRGGGGDECIFSHKLPGLAESILRFKEYLQKVILFKYTHIYIYIYRLREKDSCVLFGSRDNAFQALIISVALIPNGSFYYKTAKNSPNIQ